MSDGPVEEASSQTISYQTMTPVEVEQYPASTVSYVTVSSCRKPQTDTAIEAAEEFICGWGAALVNIAVTFPLNKIMFRQMIQGVKTTKAITQLRREGYRYLYRGILPPLLQKTTSTSLMFGIYDHTYQHMPHSTPHVFKVATAGCLAGTAEALLTPLERIQTLLQDQHHHKRFHNTWHTFKELRHFGMKEYYSGMTPVLLRNGPSNVVFFGLRDEVKKVFPDSDMWYKHVIYDFMSGAVLGAMISTFFYPLNVVRANMQTKVGGEFPSIRQGIIELYVDRGRKWSKLYYGVHVNYTRALISWGIINASYELLKKMFGLITEPS